jgi:TRAP-type transport system periplasmic protein
MSKSNKVLAIGGVVIAAAIGIAVAIGGGDKDAATTEAKTLRFSMSSNNQHPIYAGAKKFKELVEARSDININIYPSAQLGDDRAAIEMLQLGTLDISIPSTAPLSNFYKEYGVFDLPFMIPNEAVADKVLESDYSNNMLKLLERSNLVGLDFWENGFRHLTNSKHPVRTAADVKGLKIRTMESSIHLDSWKALGATPTPMAFNELFTALQQGTVDGQENPYPNIALNNLYEVQKYISNTGHVYTPLVLIFSKTTWDKLTPEEQVVMRQAAKEAGVFERKANREMNAENLATIKDKMTVEMLTPEELATFRDATKPVVEKYRASIGGDIIDGYVNEINKATAELQ